MTVIYLPLSFVTSLFGMHLFDTTDSNVVAAQSKFYITLSVLSVYTYIAAGLAFWLVRLNKKKGSAEASAPRMKNRKPVVVSDENCKEDKGGILASLRKRTGKKTEASDAVEAV